MSTPLENAAPEGATSVACSDFSLTGSSHKMKYHRYLISGSILYIILMLIFNFWKYYTNKYNVLDLAIYNQVFWNLTHGGGLYSGIQQGHYFGDHAEFFIFLLAPIYALLPHPLTLLTLQTIGLASAALPIYFLSLFIFSSPKQKETLSFSRSLRHVFEKCFAGRAAWFPHLHKIVKAKLPSFSPLFLKKRGCRVHRSLASEGEGCEPENEVSLLSPDKRTDGFSQNMPQASTAAAIIALLWLLNPILWNINFFEFHILPFTVPLLLWTIYFLLTGRIKLYFLFLVLSLLVREDVTLVTIMLGVILSFYPHPRTISAELYGTSLNPPPWKGGGGRGISLMTIMISSVWLFAATKLIQHFSADASYKYLAYYSWLGNSWPEIIKNIFSHPLAVARHVLTLHNLEMILGFLLVFAFLPLLRPKFLLLAFIPLLQFILSGSGGSAIIWQIHYAALFLPALIISSIFGLKYLLQKLPRYHFTILAIAIIVTIYNLIILGPVWPSIKQIRRDIQNKKWQTENQLYSMIPPNASVAATYTPLTKLSSRQDLYALHYLYVGKKQFSSHDYEIPEPPDYLMIDENELRTFKIQYESLSWSAATAKDGFKRLEDLITAGNYGVRERTKNLVLLQKNLNENSPYELPKISPDLRGYITLNGFRSGETLIFK